jgi:hypothetical protein
LRKKIPNLARWFNFVRATGPFLNVLGPVTLCGKAGFELAAPNISEAKKESA